jgi:antitoxin (DNA-binding transcriptional repressor) of toxin-antitoxin stability system
MITERGKPVARIIQEGRKNISIRDTLAPLAKKGLVTLPVVGLDKNRLECQKVGGRPVSEMIIEDRR